MNPNFILAGIGQHAASIGDYAFVAVEPDGVDKDGEPLPPIVYLGRPDSSACSFELPPVAAMFSRPGIQVENPRFSYAVYPISNRVEMAYFVSNRASVSIPLHVLDDPVSTLGSLFTRVSLDTLFPEDVVKRSKKGIVSDEYDKRFYRGFLLPWYGLPVPRVKSLVWAYSAERTSVRLIRVLPDGPFTTVTIGTISTTVPAGSTWYEVYRRIK